MGSQAAVRRPHSTTYAGWLKQFLPRLTMVKCNRQEAEVFAGMEIRDEHELETAADRMLETGLNCAVITLGSEGVFYKDRDGLRLRKFHKPLEPVSATGAGDSFTAAMVYGWLYELGAEASLDLAMKAAEITIMETLTVTPKIRTLTNH